MITLKKSDAVSRDQIRDAASTLAHHWSHGEPMSRIGVERLILAYPAEYQRVLCARVLWHLEERGEYTQAAAFEGLLFDLAGIEDDE